MHLNPGDIIIVWPYPDEWIFNIVVFHVVRVDHHNGVFSLRREKHVSNYAWEDFDNNVNSLLQLGEDFEVLDASN